MIRFIVEPIYYYITHSLAKWSAKDRPSGWRGFKIEESENQVIKTGMGDREPKFKVAGIARIINVYEKSGGGFYVTFAHGHWTSLFLDGLAKVEFENELPIIVLPNKWLFESCQKESFACLLLPHLQNEKLVWPDLRRGDLVDYQITMTNTEGSEGVATRLQTVKR